MEPIYNENSTVTIDENGIFVVEWKEGVTLSKEDLAKVVHDYDELSQGALWKVLHIFPRSTNVSPAARNYAEKREKPAAAEAFVIKSPIQRNMFKFYRKFRTLDYPMREFSKEDSAKEWLADHPAER